jgi:hypothetical protein
MSRYIWEIEHYMLHLGPKGWFVVLGVLVILGVLCLRGFGSRSHY